MCDFSITEKALKIAWINRVQNESSASWKIIPNYLLRHHGNLAFLSNCNYDIKTLKLGNLPDFYCSLLEYWQYVKNKIFDETDTKNEILWNNCNILIDKMSVFYKNWFTHNIIHLNDLLNEHSNFYKFHEFKAKYNFDVPFTVFYGLINAIPNAWKDKIKRQNQNGKVNQNDNTTFNTNSIYSSILKSSFVPPTSQNRILHHGFTENNVHKVYQLPFTITKEVKVIMFQYKIIHNILPTQISLYRDGFSDSDMCPLCHHEQQTLSHLLITCIKTASFWQTFQVWWYGKTDEHLLLNQGKILYGFFENTAHWQALNYLIILAKYHIFCTNGHKDEICFQSFLLRVKEKVTILKEIAVAKKQLPKFQRTWSPFFSL